MMPSTTADADTMPLPHCTKPITSNSTMPAIASEPGAA